MSISPQSAPIPRVPAATTLTYLMLSVLLVSIPVCYFILGRVQFSVRDTNPLHPTINSASSTIALAAKSHASTLSGKVTFEGTPKKYRPIDMSAEPNCAKFYPSPPMPEISVTGPQNTLKNVVVFISEGAPDENLAGGSPIIRLNQRGCRYTPHIVSAQAGQEVWVQNDDSVTHSVHPLAHANAEWNRSQPPGTPPIVIRYDNAEFVRVKCELHSWMRGILAVFKNSHHTVTDDTGGFTLPDLPPGKYTVTAWHEVYGTQSRKIVVPSEDNNDLNFVFKVTSY